MGLFLWYPGFICFKGSLIDRKYSFGNLKKEFEKNIEEIKKQGREKYLQQQAEQKAKQKTPNEAQRKPEVDHTFTIGGIKLSSEQTLILKNGGYVYLENMQKKDGSDLSAYLFFDNGMKEYFLTKQKPDIFVKYGKYEMWVMDKMRIRSGSRTLYLDKLKKLLEDRMDRDDEINDRR